VTQKQLIIAGMSSSTRQQEADFLFDLPLDPNLDQTEEPAAVAPPSPTEPTDEAQEVVVQPSPPAAPAVPVARSTPASVEPTTSVDEDWLRRQRVTLGDRLTAGALDLGVAVSVLTIVLAVVRWMGVGAGLNAWPGFVGFLLSFSFLYFVIPLSFWGQTPGMSWAGIAARWDEDLPLSFGQSTLRWVGAVFSLAFLGLPVLLGERTLSDRISGTTTVPERGDG